MNNYYKYEKSSTQSNTTHTTKKLKHDKQIEDNKNDLPFIFDHNQPDTS